MHDEDDDVDMEDKPADNTNHSDFIFTMMIVEHSKLEQIKQSFDKIDNVYVRSIAIKQAKEMKDYHMAQYQADYEQQSKLIHAFMANQDVNKNKNKNAELNPFSNIKYNMAKR